MTELCSGGELFDYLAEKGRLSEDEARIIFGQLCLAVNYIHDKGIVHRDLKLENVLLDERCRVKLGDFGFTREFDKGAYMETFCGTTGYASPEMLEGKKYLGPGEFCMMLLLSRTSSLSSKIQMHGVVYVLYVIIAISRTSPVVARLELQSTVTTTFIVSFLFDTVYSYLSDPRCPRQAYAACHTHCHDGPE